MSTQVSGRSCIFCGGKNLSGEHLLPDWVRNVLPAEEPITHFRRFGPDDSEPESVWKRKPFQEKTNFVCYDCNHGWMGRLESKAKPILAPAILRERCLFGAKEQRIAATWAFKTCLVFQASQTEDVLPPAFHFHYLRQHQEPPPQVSIWIGSNYQARNHIANSSFVQKPIAIAPLDDNLLKDNSFGTICFLSLGGIGFIVIGHRYGNKAEISYEGSLGEMIDPIWPDHSGVVLWPPSLMMDGRLIRSLMMPPGFRIRF